MQRGRFITFEGGEGSGKSTQLLRLAERLKASVPEEVVTTREPGGSPGGEALRGLFVRGEPDRWSPLAETLIISAARADHLERLIRPALARGAWVLSDRFADSTRAYQGAGGGIAAGLIAALESAVVGADSPDLTLVLDLPIEAGLARAQRRGDAEQRFERKEAGFHRRLREGYLAIVQAEPERCRLIDAGGDPDQSGEQQRKDHAGHAGGKEHPVATVCEDKHAAVLESSGLVGAGNSVQMHAQQGEGRSQFYQRGHLGVDTVVMPRPYVVAVVEMVRLVPRCRVHPRHMYELGRKHDQQRHYCQSLNKPCALNQTAVRVTGFLSREMRPARRQQTMKSSHGAQHTANRSGSAKWIAHVR